MAVRPSEQCFTLVRVKFSLMNENVVTVKFSDFKVPSGC